MSLKRRLVPTYFNTPAKVYLLADGSLKRVMSDGSMRNIDERGEIVPRRRMSKKERRALKRTLSGIPA